RLRKFRRRGHGVLRDVEEQPGRGAPPRRRGNVGRTDHRRGLYAPRRAKPVAWSRGRNTRIPGRRESVAQNAVRFASGRVVVVRFFPEIVDGKNQAERSNDCEYGEWRNSK